MKVTFLSILALISANAALAQQVVQPDLKVDPIDFKLYDEQIKKIEELAKALDSKKPNIEKLSGNGLQASYPDYKAAFDTFKTQSVAFLQSVVDSSKAVKTAATDGLQKIKDLASALEAKLSVKAAQVQAQKDNVDRYPENKDVLEKGLKKLKYEYDAQFAASQKEVDQAYTALKSQLAKMYTDEVIWKINARNPVKTWDKEDLDGIRRFDRRRALFNGVKPLLILGAIPALVIDYLTPIGWIGGWIRDNNDYGYQLISVNQGERDDVGYMVSDSYAEWMCTTIVRDENSNDVGRIDEKCVSDLSRNPKDVKRGIAAQIFKGCKTSTCVWQLVEDMKTFVDSTKDLSSGLEIGEDIHLKGRSRKDKKRDRALNKLLMESAEIYAQDLPVAEFTERN